MPRKKLNEKYKKEIDAGDSAWMLVATALVMLMVPGLALFYGGMVRRKNILATMMQSMVCLAIVGVYWIADRLFSGVRRNRGWSSATTPIASVSLASAPS